MKKFLLVMLMLLTMGISGFAQSLSDYIMTTGTDETMWETLNSPTTILELGTATSGDSKASAVTGIGFTFNFAGTDYTQFSVNSDGNLRLGATVTGTSYYTTPFSSSNANQNNPKINMLGCDGYITDSGYVHHEVIGTAPDRVCVIEFAISTFNTTSRPSLLRWQVQLFETTNEIQIVYPSTMPPILPNVARQPGMCVNSTNIILIDASHGASFYNAGQGTAHIPTGTWPDVNRYYHFTISDCPTPSGLTVSNITEDGADISWTAPANITDFIVEYKPVSGTWEDDAIMESVTGSTWTISGLDPNTYYNIRVASDCSGDHSNYVSTTIHTECVALSVTNEPYEEGFEGYTTYSFPDCWTRIAGYSTTSYDYPYVNNAAATANNGTGYLYLYNNASNPIYIALPEFVEDLSTLRLSFWMKPGGTTNYYGRVEVGLMSDLTDTTTFRTINSWTAVGIGSSSWKYYFIDLDTVTTNPGDYLVFRRYVSGTSTYAWYFDDVKVMPIPACNEPLDLDVVSVTNNSANLTWNGDDNFTFNVYYRSSEEDEYSVESNVTLDEDDIFTLTDLEASTTYEWYVSSLCSDGTENSSITSTFTTKCNAFEAPFTENFNANTRPDCWEGFSGLASAVIAGTASLTSSSDWIFTNTNVFGAYHAKINIYGTTKKGWLVTPAIDLSTLSTPTLTFDLALTKYNNANPITPGTQADDKFMVLISTDMGATWSAEDAVVWSNDDNGDYVYDQISTEGEFVAIPLTDYAGETIRIAFYGESTVSGGDNDLHIDNVSVDEAPACLPPALLTVTEITNNSVTLEWEGGNQSSWMVEYDTVGFTPGTGIFVPVSGDPTITISDLASSTEYDIYVMTDCGGTYSISAKKTVTTMCDGIATLPQTWDFDNNLTAGTSTYPLPACWNRIVTASTTLYPYAYNSSTYAHSGTRSLYFYNYYSNALGILPAIDADVFDIQDLQLSFYARCSSTSSYVRLDVGVMTDPTDDSTFTLIQTIPLTTSHPSDPYVVSFSNYTGEGTYIAFRNTSTSTSSASNYFYIDDVTLEEAPACSKALYLSAVPDAFSADLTWMAEGEDFDVYYKAASDAEYTEVTNVVLDEDGVFTLTGLNSSTTYTWYVITNCEDTVYTSSTATFTTLCAPFATPFIEDFSAGVLPNCWERFTGLASAAFSGTAPTATTSGWTTFSNTNVFGNNHPKLNIYGTTYKYWLVTPVIDLTDLSDPALTFNLALTDFGNANQIEDTTDQYDDKFMVIISTDAGATWSAANATIWSNDSTGDFVYNQISHLGEEVSISLENYAGQNIRIAFYGESTVSNGDNDLHIDNVVVGEAPSCSAPSQLLVREIDQTSAVVTWTENGTASSWILEYDTAGFEIGTGNIVTITDGVPTATLSDLEPATSYEVYVQAVCPDGGNSNPASATFRTACVALDEIPQTWNFDGIGTGINVHPDCWICYNTYSSTQYPYVYGTNPYSGNADLYFYSSSSTYSLAVLPMVDVNTYPMNTLQVSFMMRSYTPASVRMVVGVMTDPGNITTFEAVDTVYNNASGVYELKEVALNNYEGSAPYVALKMINLSSATYAYVDDVTLDYIPSCPRPQHLTVTDVTTTSVELEWTDNSSASSWEIAYGEPGFDPDDDNEATYVTANTNPFTVQNLNSSSTFDFYVRALCSTSDMSPWSEKVSTSTTMVPIDLPYTATFDANDAWVLNNGTCTNYWTKGTVDNEGALFVTNNGTTPGYTITSISVVSAQKLFTVGASDSITITFDVEVKGESTWDYMKLFLAPESTEFPATTTVPTGTYGVNTYTTNAYDFYTNGYGSQSGYHYIMNMATGTVHVVAKMPNPNATPTTSSTALLVFAWKNDGSGGTQPPATITNLTVTANGSAPVVTDPTVATNAASAIAQTSATLNATITNPDGVAITAKGFEWKATTGGTYTQIAGTGTGNTFTANLTDLNANTNYTYKAFITFNGTTVYGSEMNFTTQNGGGETCNVPTNLTANATAYNAANVTWTAGGNEGAWTLQYKAASATDWNNVTVTVTNYQLTLLTAETEYQVRVQANCYDGIASDWATTSFTTPAVPVDPCDAPTGLTVTNITHNSATASWTAGGDETSWSVQFKSQNAGQWQETTVQTTTFTMNGLTPQTAYDVRVKAICAPGNESDFISGEFTTNPDAIDNITLANSISLMPNPADNYIDLRINNNVNVKEAVVYNAFGQMIQTVELNDNHARIDLSNMAAGMYFVRVNGDNVSATKKFIRK